MATTITQSVLQALQTSVSSRFKQGYADVAGHADLLATTVPSTTAVNTYGWMKAIPQMREWLGPRVINSLDTNAYQLVNKKYELTIGCPRTDIEDDQLGLFGERVAQLGRQARYLPTQLVLEAVDAGFTELGFDGVPHFSANHPLDPAGNQSNLTSAAGGIAVLNRTNWVSVRTAMQSITGEDGRPLNIMPNLVFISPDLEDAAQEIFNNGLIGGGNSNQSQGQGRYHVVQEWAGRNDWMVCDTTKGIKPFIFQRRKSPVLVPKTSNDDDNVFFTDQYIWGIDARAVAGFGPWWLCHYVQNTA